MLLVSFSGTFSQSYNYRWYDVRWHYRVGLEINSTFYNRTDWPVEYAINFTRILNNMSVYGTFDENSTRVVEYNSSGTILYEVPSQFDKSDGYNASTNAVGTAAFSMNGTSVANHIRYFYIYFDTIENGNKQAKSYTTDLAYNYTGANGNMESFSVNNTLFRWGVNTALEENTSGFYQVQDALHDNDILLVDPSVGKAAEYSSLSNASDVFGFDFRNNATLKYAGPARIVFEQRGNEIKWNQPGNMTEGYMIKRYTFYRYLDWIKIEQIFVNNATYSITRNSTVSGALGMNLTYTFRESEGNPYYNNMSNPADPGSYGWANQYGGTFWMGLVNINETGTSNFFALFDSATGMMGVQLTETTIAAGSSISHTTVVQFNASGSLGAEDHFLGFVNQSITLLNITTHAGEIRTVFPDGKFYANATNQVQIFNRNETVIIWANVSDLYNVSGKINASINKAGVGQSNITLYDDGSHNDSAAGDGVFANIYGILDADATGVWNTTFTAYNQSGYALNTSSFPFNVTSTYNATVNITNPTGFTGRQINATVSVRNFRQDRWIANATINCTFASTEVPQQNISDLGNGTYRLWFAAPSYADLFTLSCNVARNNNTGYAFGEFTCETYDTNVSITSDTYSLVADNVTSYSNQIFNISVMVKNIANGSAYDLNITLNFSSPNITANTTVAFCGDLLLTKNCTKTFQIIVLGATPPANYTANISVRWRNSNALPGFNSSAINISVLTNPLMNVPKNFVLGIIASGRPPKNIDNFTVDALGNVPLQNVNFTLLGFPENLTFLFVPYNSTSIGVGVSQNVEIWVNSSTDITSGEYNGTINVTTANAGHRIINVTIAVAGTNMTIALDKYNFTAENVSWYNGQNFSLAVNTTNIGNSTAYNATIKINLSSANITANETAYLCGNIGKALGCTTTILFTVLPTTHSGNYTANVSIEWEDPESGKNSNSTMLNITVTSHINLTVPTDSIVKNVTHGTQVHIGNITLNSTGNDPSETIAFAASNFSPDFTFLFIPSDVASLGGEYPGGVMVNVTAKIGTLPGLYTGLINVTSANGGYKEIAVNITVPTSRTWTLNTTYCEKVMSPEEGVACDVLVNNTGNVDINFTIIPATSSSSMLNRTWTSAVNFTVANVSNYTLFVQYNITNQTIKFYYANYTIDAIQAGSSPNYTVLQVVLNPFIKPSLSMSFTPNITEQLGETWIYVNVTDQSGAGIGYNATDSNVTVTVTRPDGVNSTVMMTFTGTASGGITKWNVSYPENPFYFLNPGIWGNTTLKGYYNVTIYAVDNRGKNNTINSSFFIYYKLFIDLNTTRYAYRGDSLEVRIKSRDAVGTPLAGANVNISFVDPNGGNKDYYFWNGRTFVTDANGDAGALYLVPTNAILGNYTFSANGTYNETSVNKMINATSSFPTEVRDASKVKAELGIPYYVYREKVMPISVFILDNGECMASEPETIDITIYYTEGYTPQTWRVLHKSNMTQNMTCFYTYNELISSSTLTGTYLAVMRVGNGDKEAWDMIPFSITTGGPYDVSINMLDTEVTRSDYADFELTLINMGGTTPDVLLEYWISGANQTWDYRSESLMINAYANRTLIRSLYVVSGQPLGQYFINAKVTYDSTQPVATANSSFLVVEGGTQPPQPPAGGPAEEGAGAGAPSLPPKIEIIKYPQELGMELDSVKYPTIEVKNSGGSKLYNVTIKISGIPSPWIQDISPKVVDSLGVGNSTIFTITLKIPPTAETKEYVGQITANSSSAKDQKSFSITLFASRAELIRWEIERLTKAVQELESDIANAQKAGKNVKDVLPYVDQIKEQIRLSEDYLEKKMYDESLSAVHTGWSILEKARYLLAQAPFTEILMETIIPPWLIIILVILAIVIGALLFMVKKMRGVFDKVFRMQVPGAAGAAKASVFVEKMKEKETFEKEEANVRRVLGLLEREFKEGLISENAYADLKRRNEEKLVAIDKKKAAFK
ncbi:MAG: hypothetical protein NTU57_01160 [Candidatus Aenigmarchaeota archaeon]|nr:hypothetical protein [Candidatus Aenigmarchaeota archaeon]